MTAVRDYVLIETLKLAVPLHIDDLRDATPQQRQRLAREAAQVIASQGDVLMFGGRKGAAANAFNHLARGLAAAAYQPGGVDFAGQHWCTDHAPCEHASPRGAELTVEPPRPRRPVVDLELPA